MTDDGDCVTVMWQGKIVLTRPVQMYAQEWIFLYNRRETSWFGLHAAARC